MPLAARISLLAAALFFFSFAAIAGRPHGAHAASPTCDDEVHTRFEVEFTTQPSFGYRITGVVVTDISDTCMGGKVVVSLSAGDTVVASGGPVTVSAAEMTVPISQGPMAIDVTKITVQLSTLAAIPTPTEDPGLPEPVVVASPPPAVAASPPPAAPSAEPHVSEQEVPSGDVPFQPAPSFTPAVSSTPEPGTPTPVIVAQVPPVTPTPTPPSSTPEPTPEPERSQYQPELVDNILGIGDIATSPQAILSNAGLSAGLLALMLIDTTIFNAILKENAFLIHAFVQRRLRWFRGIFGRPVHLPNTAVGPAGILKPFVVLSLSAVIYSLLDPHFGLNNSSLVLFLSLFFGLAVATYVNDGGQVLVAERRFGIPFSLQFFPAAIGIAIVSIFVSRVADIHPGIIFGFVAGAREASHVEPDDEQDGVINFLPMATLLVVSVAAWLAIGPVDSIAGGNTFVGTVVEASCAMLFVGSVQGLLFTLLPLQFMDGQKVWRWNKLAWLSIALPVAFLFFHTVLNQGATLASASSSHGVIALYVSAGVAWVLTVVAWVYFRKVNPEGASQLKEDLEDVTP